MPIFDKNYALSGVETELMVEQALETLLWSEFDWEHDEQQPLDELFTTSDFAEESVKTLREELLAFVEDEANAEDLDTLDIAQIAHDFILTRNGHGTGFWDRGYPNGIGERLTKAVKPFGTANVYQGDDGKLYIS